MYNLTNVMGTGNSSGMLDFVVGVNTELMQGWLGDMFLIGFTFILFISFYLSTQDISKTTMGTFMIVFVISMAMSALQLVHTQTPFIALFFLIAGVVMSYSSKQ